VRSSTTSACAKPSSATDATIKDYDRRIIVDEKAALFGPDKPWDWDLVPLDVPIIGYSRRSATVSIIGIGSASRPNT
jgi:hypothetical protein